MNIKVYCSLNEWIHDGKDIYKLLSYIPLAVIIDDKYPKLLDNGRWVWSMGLNYKEKYVIHPEIFKLMYPDRAYSHDTKGEAIDRLANAVLAYAIPESNTEKA